MYYRYSGASPMSRKGYAMFLNEDKGLAGYGDHKYIFNGTDAVNFEDLKDEVLEKLEEQGMFDGEDLEQVWEDMNPQDILDHAGIFDSEELTQWLWDNVLERHNIKALLTHDGAVVFDQALITEVENEYLI